MRNITIRNRKRKKIFNRNEVNARMINWVYVTTLLFFLGVLLGMLLRGYTEQFHIRVERAVGAVEASEILEEGQVATEVIAEEIDPSESVTVSATVKPDPIPHIRAFRNSIAQSNMDDKKLETIYHACKDDLYSTELVVAIAFAETTLNSAKSGKVSNYWGWFPGGDRGYDPDFEIMAQVICNGIRNNYVGVESHRQLAITYTGNDRVDTWLHNVNFALSEMRKGK